MRIACLIWTSPKSHKTKAAAVKSTWGRHCTKLLFITTQQDDDLGTLVIDIEEKYEHLWGKTRNAFKFMYENHLQDFDWFLKGDDDTYVIMENLRYLLHPYSPEMPIWFGFNFKLGPGKEKVHAYMSGGSGYVLSREALRRFGNVSLNTPSGCKVDDDTGAEDAEMGICLKTANVVAGDSRDSSQKIRFGIFNPDGALIGKLWPNDFWYLRKSFFQIYNSREALSNYAVSFHYISPAKMHMYEYLLYEFEAVGLEQPLETLPRKLFNEEVIRPVADNDWE